MYTEKAISIAITYSEILNGDSIETALKKREKNSDYEYWKSIADNTLQRNKLKYLYVMNVNYNDSIEYYISAKDHMGQIEFLGKDHIDEFESDMVEKLKQDGNIHRTSVSYTQKYGLLISAYVPVKNSNGEVVAFVGADKDMEDLVGDVKRMGIKFLILSILFMAIVFSITLFIVRRLFIQPIVKLVKAADNFNMLNISFDDLGLTRIVEYDSLIKSFMKMETKIRNAIKKSFTDDLTKLNNRYFFTLSLENILKTAKQKKKIAFMIVDIDYFKHINDTYGHEKGDFVLRGVGVVLRQVFQGSEGVVARLGGDEFAICVENIPDKQFVENKCKAIKEQFSQIKCSEDEKGTSASIGVVITNIGEASASYSEIFSAADAALYKVKAEGRNGHRIDEI
jgi:diguanylate cyclase (GGDEF)-like protein